MQLNQDLTPTDQFDPAVFPPLGDIAPGDPAARHLALLLAQGRAIEAMSDQPAAAAGLAYMLNNLSMMHDHARALSRMFESLSIESALLVMHGLTFFDSDIIRFVRLRLQLQGYRQFSPPESVTARVETRRLVFSDASRY